MVSIRSRFYRQRCSVRRFCSVAVMGGLALLSSVGCSKSDNHVPVYPVAGTIQFQGKPISGAFITLEPKTSIDGVPGPRATVAPDGSFALSTYNGGDGAPEGEYLLAVQWYKPIRQDGELVGGPNALPAKYASTKSSGLHVRVAAGENQLKPIQLR